MGRRRKWTKEFKEECVAFLKINEDRSITDVANDLGVPRDQLSRWNRELREFPDNAFPGNGIPRDEEIYRLRKEIASLREERDILKKAMAIFSRQQG